MQFQLLLSLGPALLQNYRDIAEGTDLSAARWDRQSILKVALTAEAQNPGGAFTKSRHDFIKVCIDIAMPRALADLNSSLSFLDPDVAQALAHFPNIEGMTLLQIQTSAVGSIEPHSDAHITSSLLESSRQLYHALIKAKAYERIELMSREGDAEPLDVSVLT